MSLLEIDVQPSGTETHHEMAVLLDGSRYRLTAYTNACDERWYLDVTNDDGTAVVRGLAMAAGVDLLHPYRHLDVPPGYLFVVGDGSDPDPDAFRDRRARLLYLEVTT